MTILWCLFLQTYYLILNSQSSFLMCLPSLQQEATCNMSHNTTEFYYIVVGDTPRMFCWVIIPNLCCFVIPSLCWVVILSPVVNSLMFCIGVVPYNVHRLRSPQKVPLSNQRRPLLLRSLGREADVSVIASNQQSLCPTISNLIPVSSIKWYCIKRQ